MDYSKLSDQQINAAVAKKFPERFMFDDEGNPYSLEPDCAATYTGSDFDEVEFDPCNNPADAWPIILCNRITLMPASKGDKWMAQAFDHAIADVSTNPLRSAMIVFLMMQESE